MTNMKEPLKIPGDGIYFNFWKLLVHFNFSRSGLWGRDLPDGTRQKIHIFFGFIYDKKRRLSLYQIVILRLTMQFAVVDE